MNHLLYIVLLMISVFGFRLKSSAQFSSAQKEAISTIDYFELEYEPRKPKFLKLGKNPIVNYNPITLTFGGALFLYQKVISPQLQSRCPYEISCSAFSFASIQEYGLLKGVALSADRLTRCTQFTTIDMLPSQMNDRSGMLIDNPSKYSVKGDHTGHDHK